MKSTRNKFGAVRVNCSCPIGTHPSMLEKGVCYQMEIRQQRGEITDIKRQSTVDLGDRITWKVDFSFTVVLTGERRWAEAKGKWQTDALIKKKIWSSRGPGPLELWEGDWKSPRHTRTIIPTNPNQEIE